MPEVRVPYLISCGINSFKARFPSVLNMLMCITNMKREVNILCSIPQKCFNGNIYLRNSFQNIPTHWPLALWGAQLGKSCSKEQSRIRLWDLRDKSHLGHLGAMLLSVLFVSEMNQGAWTAEFMVWEFVQSKTTISKSRINKRLYFLRGSAYPYRCGSWTGACGTYCDCKTPSARTIRNLWKR